MRERLVKVRDQVKGLRGGNTPKAQIARLRRRVVELENEMQEARRLNRRVAELLDIVEELLVPVAQRDEDRIRKYLAQHGQELAGPTVDTPAR